ncbi:hypothetical protein J6590_027711 [Homalodisca vitripennis]|nr:hypothetical protein J6590_027711 [Homalodisca vitripennis]
MSSGDDYTVLPGVHYNGDRTTDEQVEVKGEISRSPRTPRYMTPGELCAGISVKIRVQAGRRGARTRIDERQDRRRARRVGR